MRLEHHLVGGYVRYISPLIIIIIITVLWDDKQNIVDWSLNSKCMVSEHTFVGVSEHRLNSRNIGV